MTKLEEKIMDAQDHYYNGQPIMPDNEFDALWDKLKKENPGSILFKKVGEDSSSNFNKAEHVIFMNSQEKVNNEKDFEKWWEKRVTASAIVQYKLDGISIELQYKNGNLYKAVTRGDGCLDRNSILEFEDGSFETIEDVVKNKTSKKVKSYNHEEEKIEFKEIENYFINQNEEDWYEIELDNGKRIKLTGNHQIFETKSKKYIRAKEIKEGDVLLIQ